MDRLAVGTGRSRADDALDAGWFAASEALAGLQGAKPGLILVDSSARYALSHLVGAVRTVTGTTPLVGASSSGQFCEGEFLAPGAGVVVLAEGPYRFGTASVTGLRCDAQDAGRRPARRALAAVGPDRPPHDALLLLADGMDGTPEELLTGVHAVTGAHLPAIGGAADRFPGDTFVLHDDEVHDGAVLDDDEVHDDAVHDDEVHDDAVHDDGAVHDEALGGVPEPAVLLVFSCVARVELLGDRAGEEAARPAAAAGVVPTFGFCTLGEFARTTSVTGYHNATIAALAL